MIYLSDLLGSKTVTIIPRTTTFNKLIVTFEATGVSEEINTFTVNELEIGVSITFDFDFQIDQYYLFDVKNGSDFVYRDKLLYSDQIKEAYTVNKDVYVSKESNNDFVIYE